MSDKRLGLVCILVTVVCMATTTGNGVSTPMQLGVENDRRSESPVEGRLETTIKIKIGTDRSNVLKSNNKRACVCLFHTTVCIGEIKGIPAGTSNVKPHDIFVSVLLDQEELYRTTTIEKAVKLVDL